MCRKCNKPDKSDCFFLQDIFLLVFGLSFFAGRGSSVVSTLTAQSLDCIRVGEGNSTVSSLVEVALSLMSFESGCSSEIENIIGLVFIIIKTCRK